MLLFLFLWRALLNAIVFKPMLFSCFGIVRYRVILFFIGYSVIQHNAAL
jgi:hypothetical protein